VTRGVQKLVAGIVAWIRGDAQLEHRRPDGHSRGPVLPATLQLIIAMIAAQAGFWGMITPPQVRAS
jgi:hypothetical protein